MKRKKITLTAAKSFRLSDRGGLPVEPANKKDFSEDHTILPLQGTILRMIKLYAYALLCDGQSGQQDKFNTSDSVTAMASNST